jgi:hypothetical protein
MASNDTKITTTRQVTRLPNTRRGIWLSALVVIFLLLAAAGWLRTQQTLAQWNLLAAWGIWPGPLYNALSGAVWGVVGLPAAWGLWFRKRWADRLTWIAAWFYPVAFWLDRLFIARSPEARTGWPFWLAVTLLWLGYVFAVLRSRRVLLVNEIKLKDKTHEQQRSRVGS